MPELSRLTIQEAGDLLLSGDISCRELTQYYLNRIELLEPEIKAFITTTPQGALEQADLADLHLTQVRKDPDRKKPPLLGIPFAIKDVLTVDGVRCTAGSKILENFIPPYDATCVDRLLQQKAVILGKTNTDEFAMGSSTENSAYKTTSNPWNPDRVPGGSSGGSAAAVAAGMAMCAFGTDTGGSVRQPASYCGVTGLKPTYGRISRFGLIAFGSSLDTVGILGKNVLDVSCVYKQIAGHDHLDSTSQNRPVEGFSGTDEIDLRGLRIGIPDEYFTNQLQPEIESALDVALSTFQSLGAEIKNINLPHTSYALPVYYIIAPAEASANLARFDGIRYGPRINADEWNDVFRKTRGGLFGREVKRRIMLGTYALSSGYYDDYYNKAQKVRTLIRQDFETAFKQVDIIAAPVSPTTAFEIGKHSGDPLAMYLEDVFTLPANLSGIPGLTFPIGFDKDSLPIGMQLMSSHFNEFEILKVSHGYQLQTNWHRRFPPIQDSNEADN